LNDGHRVLLIPLTTHRHCEIQTTLDIQLHPSPVLPAVGQLMNGTQRD